MKKLINFMIVLMISSTSFGQVFNLKIQLYTHTIVNDSIVNDTTITVCQTTGYIDSLTTVLTIHNNEKIDSIKVYNYVPNDPQYIKYYIFKNSNNQNIIDSILKSDTYIVHTQLINNNDIPYFFKLFVIDSTTNAGINDYDLESHASMLVYPNPASVNTKVKFYAGDINTEVNIYSMTGELVYSNTDTRNVGQMNEIDVNVYDFKQGVYFVKVGALSRRLVVE